MPISRRRVSLFALSGALSIGLLGCSGLPSGISAATVSTAVSSGVPGIQAQLSQLNQISAMVSAAQADSSATGASSGTAKWRLAAITPGTAPGAQKIPMPGGDFLNVSFTGAWQDSSTTPTSNCYSSNQTITDASGNVLETSVATECVAITLPQGAGSPQGGFPQGGAPQGGAPQGGAPGGGAGFSFSNHGVRDVVVSQSTLRGVGAYHDTMDMSSTMANAGVNFGATESIAFTPAGQTTTYTTTRYGSMVGSQTGGVAHMVLNGNAPGGATFAQTADATFSMTTGSIDQHMAGSFTTAASGSLAFDMRMTGTAPTGTSGASAVPTFTNFLFTLTFTDAKGTKYVITLNKATPASNSKGTMSGILADGSNNKLADLTTTADFAANTWTGTLTYTDGTTATIDLSCVTKAMQAAMKQS